MTARRRLLRWELRFPATIASFAVCLLFAGLLRAAATRIAATASARDFLAGDASGTAVTAEGRLTLSGRRVLIRGAREERDPE